MGASLGSLGSLGSIFVDLNLNTAGFTQGITNAESKFKTIGKKFTSVGRGISLGISAPLALLGVSILKTAGDFEVAINKIAAVTGTEGTPALDEMREAAKKWGSTTKFSAVQVGEAMAFLGQANFDATQIIAAMPGVLDLAAAGQIDLAVAADKASNVMGQFGLKAEDMGRIADVLATGASSANTDITQLTQALTLVGPVAAGAGLSLEETVAAIGTLGNQGIQATRAGTGLRAVLASLISPSDDAAAALEAMGADVEALGRAAKNPIDALAEMGRQGLAINDVFTIFGREAASVGAVLAENAGQTDNLNEKFKDITGNAGKMAEIMQQGLVGAMVKMGSAFEGLKLEIADAGLIDFATDLVVGLTGIIQKVSEFSPSLLSMGVVIAGVAIIAGPLIIAIGFIATAIGTIGIPVAAAIAGIGLLIGGFIAFKDDLGGALGSFQTDWEIRWTKIKDFVLPLFEALKFQVTETFTSIVETAGPLFEKFVSLIGSGVDAVIAVLGFPGVLETIGFVWDSIGIIIGTAWDLIIGVVSGAVEVIGGIFKVLTGILTLDWETFSGGVVDIITGLRDTVLGIFESLFGGIIGVVGSFGGAIIDTFSNIGKRLTGTVEDDFVDPVIAEFMAMAEESEDAFDRVGDAAKDQTRELNKFADLFDDVRESAGVRKGAARGVKELTDKIKLFSLTTAIRQADAYDKALKDLVKQGMKELVDIVAPQMTPALIELTSQMDNATTSALNLGTMMDQSTTPPISDATIAAVNLENAFGNLGIESDELRIKRLQKLRADVDLVRIALGKGEASTDDLKNAQKALQKAIDGPQGSKGALDNLSTSLGDLGKQISDDLIGLFRGQGSIADVGKAAFDTLKNSILDIAGESVMGVLSSAITGIINKLTGSGGLGSALSGIFGGGGSGGGGVSVPSGGGGAGAGGGGFSIPGLDVFTGLASLGSSIFGNFQNSRIISTLGLIEKEVRVGTDILGDGGDGGIKQILFDIKEGILFGTAVKAVEAIALDVAGLGAQFINPSLDTMKDRLLTIANNTSGITAAVEGTVGDVEREIGDTARDAEQAIEDMGREISDDSTSDAGLVVDELERLKRDLSVARRESALIIAGGGDSNAEEIIAAIRALESAILNQPPPVVNVTVDVDQRGRVTGTVAGRGRGGDIVPTILKAIDLNQGGLRSRIGNVRPVLV